VVQIHPAANGPEDNFIFLLPYIFCMVSWRGIVDHPIIVRVASSRGYSRSTVEFLAKVVADFMKFVEVDSVEALLEKFKSMSLDDILAVFKSYFIFRRQVLAPKTIWNWSNAFRVFLFENGIRVDRISKDITMEYKRYVSRRGIPKLLKRDIIEKDDIRRLILAGDTRSRALISVLASSGLRIGVSALKLQLKHFRDPLDKELPAYMLEIPEELTKAEYGQENPHITFISREARDYLLAYLKKREAKGEKITPESYLFVTYRNGEPEPLTYAGARHIWNRLCSAAGIDRRPVPLPGAKTGSINKHKQVIRYNVRIHSLRKYFKTACSLMGVDRVATEAMLGHSLAQFGIESVYDYCIQNLEWLRDQYLRALPALTFVAELPQEIAVANHQAREEIKLLKERIAALEEATRFYEALLKHLQKKNPKLLKELGID